MQILIKQLINLLECGANSQTIVETIELIPFESNEKTGIEFILNRTNDYFPNSAIV